MIGDKIHVQPQHTRAAKAIYAVLKDRIGHERVAVTVAGSRVVMAFSKKIPQPIGDLSPIFALIAG